MFLIRKSNHQVTKDSKAYHVDCDSEKFHANILPHLKMNRISEVLGWYIYNTACTQDCNMNFTACKTKLFLIAISQFSYEHRSRNRVGVLVYCTFYGGAKLKSSSKITFLVIFHLLQQELANNNSYYESNNKINE